LASGKSSVEVIAAVAADLRGFVAAAEPFDDITMLALRWTGATGG
jgi:hypothetical protein